MSNTRISREKRLEVIRCLLPKGFSQEEIANRCGVTRRTIVRDIGFWKESGGFEEWLHQEFFRLHNIVQEENSVVAYHVIVKLFEKFLRKVDSKDDSKKIIVNFSAGLESNGSKE
jgi:hypothetical protein